MPIKITLPRLGWSMDEGTFSEWLKRDGESVLAGDLLFALESDKATQEVESLDAGVLHIPQDAPKHGDIVKVGQLLGYLLAEGESIPLADSKAAVSTPTADPLPFPHVIAPVTVSPLHAIADAPIISPRARRVAAELGVRDRMAMIVNRANSGVSVADMERTVGMPALACIRSAGLLFVRAANEGRTVIERFPREKVSGDFNSLAEEIIGQTGADTVSAPAKASVRGLFGRSKEPART